MSEQDQSSNGALILLVGIAVGVAAGLLLAPRGGRETRRRLRNWLEDLEETGKDVVEQGRDIFEDVKDVLKEKTKRTAEGKE